MHWHGVLRVLCMYCQVGGEWECGVFMPWGTFICYSYYCYSSKGDKIPPLLLFTCDSITSFLILSPPWPLALSPVVALKKQSVTVVQYMSVLRICNCFPVPFQVNHLRSIMQLPSWSSSYKINAIISIKGRKIILYQLVNKHHSVAMDYILLYRLIVEILHNYVGHKPNRNYCA